PAAKWICGIQHQYIQISLQAQVLIAVVQYQNITAQFLLCEFTALVAVGADYYLYAFQFLRKHPGLVSSLIDSRTHSLTVRDDHLRAGAVPPLVTTAQYPCIYILIDQIFRYILNERRLS